MGKKKRGAEAPLCLRADERKHPEVPTTSSCRVWQVLAHGCAKAFLELLFQLAEHLIGACTAQMTTRVSVNVCETGSGSPTTTLATQHAGLLLHDPPVASQLSVSVPGEAFPPLTRRVGRSPKVCDPTDDHHLPLNMTICSKLSMEVHGISTKFARQALFFVNLYPRYSRIICASHKVMGSIP